MQKTLQRLSLITLYDEKMHRVQGSVYLGRRDYFIAIDRCAVMFGDFSPPRVLGKEVGELHP
jgi:hypothetical protein